jgi:membrane protein YqaA with SNARE-associated domain
MTRITAWIEAFALTIGGLGIFVIAFLDSSFLSFPEVNDFLIILMVVRHPTRMIFYASMATLGSVAGCLALYFVARKGGEAMVSKRFHPKSIEWAMGLMRKHGYLSLMVPALLPPPAPFKIFVLMAGVAAVPIRTFLIAIGVGRGVRYFGEGILALLWGEAALQYVHENGAIVALALAVLALVGGVGYLWWRKRLAGAAGGAKARGSEGAGERKREGT